MAEMANPNKINIYPELQVFAMALPFIRYSLAAGPYKKSSNRQS